MKVDFFILAENAYLDSSEKLTLERIIGLLAPPGFPAGILGAWLALRIAYEPDEVGQHTIQFRFTDMDSNELSSSSIQTEFPHNSMLITPRLQKIVKIDQMLQFPKPGNYFFEAWIDGIKMAEHEIVAVKGA
jgi:hypothetical protein